MSSKKKECPSCAMEVDANGKTCPICNYEFTSASGGGRRWIAVFLLILILVYFLFQMF